MPLAIVTDSSASLPREQTSGLPLFTVPLEVHHGGRTYRDGIDLTPAEFYALQESAGTPPTTSAPPPGAFLEAFTHAATKADEIICLTLSADLSTTNQAAQTARDEVAGMLPATRIEVVDSRSAAAAQGLVALAAARMAAQGATADDVLRTMPRWLHAVHLYGYLGTLHYLWRSGRVPRLIMWVGRMLDVKPVLALTNGTIGMVERPRTARRAMARVVALAAERASSAPVRVAVIHAHAAAEATDLADRLGHALAPTELFVTELTPVIGAHTGPGLVGCAVHVLSPDDEALFRPA